MNQAFKNAVASLRNIHKEYVDAVVEDIHMTGINSEGKFYSMGDALERSNKIERLNRMLMAGMEEVERCRGNE